MAFIPLFGEKQYLNRVLAMTPTAFWPLNEGAGATADNLQGNAAYDGAYANVTLGSAGITPGAKSVALNGATSYLSIAGVAPAFSGAAGSFSLWLKPSAKSVWADATVRRLMTIYVDVNNYVLIRKSNTTNLLQLEYKAGGTVELINSIAAGQRPGWTHVCATWSKANERVRFYIDGVLVGSSTTLGTWAGTPIVLTVGAGNTTPIQVWSGNLAGAALWARELTADEVLTLAMEVNRAPVVGSRLAMHLLARGGNGVWSTDGAYLLFDSADANADWQLYKVTADGVTVTLLTDPAPTGAPAATLHKGWPHFHPSADWAVVQAEISGQPLDPYWAVPNRGLFNDLYIFKPSTNTGWAALTNYGATGSQGVLHAAFSLDGTRLIWAEKYAAADATYKWGKWKIAVADFNSTLGTIDFAGRSLYEPLGVGWYEPHGETAAGNILFAHDRAGTRPYAPDLGIYNVAGNTVTDITDSADNWDEHGSTDAAHYYYASTIPYGPVNTAQIQAGDYTTLKAEAFQVSGGHTTRLSYFNHPGRTEYSPEPCYAYSIEAGPTGKFAITRHQQGASYDTADWRHLYILTRKT